MFDAWSEPGELLAAGDVALAVGTNGRFSDARRAGGEIGISWHGGLVASDYFVIPKGSTRKELAQELVRYSVGREAQDVFARLRGLDAGPRPGGQVGGGRRKRQRGPVASARRPSTVARGRSSSSAAATYQAS